MQIVFSPHQIDYNNRAVAYGDGCFTTLCWKGGKLKDVSYHLSRLETSCQRLNILDFNAKALSDFLLQEVTPALKDECVIKILVSLSAGGRGYARPEKASTEVFISQHSMPEIYEKWRLQGVDLGLSPVQLAKQPLLAGIKHLNRLEQVLTKHSQVERIDDCLVTDTDGMLVEASAANVFWRCGGQWFTPDLYYCGVNGIIRTQLIEQLTLSNPVTLVRAKPQILQHAQEVVICNSVMGLVPVKSVFLGSEPLTHFDVRSSFFQQLNNALSKGK